MTPILRKFFGRFRAQAPVVAERRQRMVVAIASVLEQIGASWQIDKVELLPRGESVRVTVTFRDPLQRYGAGGIYQQADFVLGPEEGIAHAYELTEVKA